MRDFGCLQNPSKTLVESRGYMRTREDSEMLLNRCESNALDQKSHVICSLEKRVTRGSNTAPAIFFVPVSAICPRSVVQLARCCMLTTLFFCFAC